MELFVADRISYSVAEEQSIIKKGCNTASIDFISIKK